ncbi:MAG: SH3 domain-containing protein, partial [Pseudomonadota bacterium]
RRRQERWTERRDNCGDRTRCIERRTERRMARLNDRLENVIRRRNAGSDIDLDDDASSDTSGGASRLVICARGFVDNGSGRCIRDRGRAEQREATLGDDSFAGGSTGAGRSLGGNVRDIPGLDGRQTAKLREGERVELIENTGERYQGYDWFKIRHRGGVGYQWGGILCANRRTSGVYEVCR